jgi:hypothetical protein
MNHLADIILFPLYTALFALVFYFRRRRLKDPILRRYHRNAFWLKVFSAFAFIIFSLFLAKLDSTHLYYPEGMNITRLILKDFSNIRLLFIEGKEFDPDLLADTLNRGYFSSESNFFIARLVSVLSFISFGSYSVITLLFSLISFTGVWRLYRFFYEQYPHLHRQLAIAVLYLPNFVFWSSGILKDPLCTGMLGWFTYGMYRIFIRKESILLYSFVSLVSGYILGLVKAYILVSFLPFLLLFIIITKLRRIQATAIRVILFISILIVGGIGVWLVGARLQSEMEELALSKITESVQSTQQNFMRIADLAESSFSLGVEYDGTAAGLFSIARGLIV